MTTLAVDGNWVLHRAFHTQFYESQDPAADIARKFVSMVCKDALLVKARSVLIAFDGARVFRHALYKGYKVSRGTKEGPSPYDSLGGLLEYLAYCGLPTVQLVKYEADDVLCSVATQNPKVVISCKDKDAYQYVRPGVRLLDGSAKPEPRILTHNDIESVFGVPPSLCLDLQTLMGDPMDDVPCIVSRAAAINGLKKWGSLKAWVNGDRAFRQSLDMDQLKLNRKLVRLVPDLKVEPQVPKWNKGQDMTLAYTRWKDFANPRSRGLF